MRKSSFSLWWRIFSRTLRWWHLLVFAVVAMVGYAFSNLAMVYLIGPALTTLFSPESATLSRQLSALAGSSALKAKLAATLAPLIYRETPLATLKHFCFVLVVVVLAKNAFQYVQNITSVQLLQTVTNEFRKEMFDRLMSLPLSFFHKNKVGDLMSRVISDVQMMQESISVTIADMVRDPLQVGVYYAFLLAIDYRLTLVMTLVVPVVVFVMSTIGRFLRRYGARTQRRMSELASVLQEGLAGIRVVKAFSAEGYERSKFRRIADRYFRSLMKMYRVRRLAGPFNEAVGVFAAAAILWFAGRKVLAGTGPTPAEFMQYVVTLLLMMQPIKAFSDKVNRVQQGLAAAERVFWLLDQTPYDALRDGTKTIKELRRGIRYENVTFFYDGSDKPAVKDFTLEIPRGSMVALVGHSGGGKSTIADLLARLYDPTSGAILVDGEDLRNLSRKSWRSLLGIVTQEVILFNDTVLANIAYGDPSPDMDRVVAAAKAANALEFIEKLPQKFDTVIGDRGVKLSGGERQRIAIARAIYRNPQILIFDEATSALDSRSERLVQEAIERLVAGRTALVIAHRLSTVRRADKIVVVEGGRKVCEGTHQTLLRTCPLYRELYEVQFEV